MSNFLSTSSILSTILYFSIAQASSLNINIVNSSNTPSTDLSFKIQKSCKTKTWIPRVSVSGTSYRDCFFVDYTKHQLFFDADGKTRIPKEILGFNEGYGISTEISLIKQNANGESKTLYFNWFYNSSKFEESVSNLFLVKGPTVLIKAKIPLNHWRDELGYEKVDFDLFAASGKVKGKKSINLNDLESGLIDLEIDLKTQDIASVGDSYRLGLNIVLEKERSRVGVVKKADKYRHVYESQQSTKNPPKLIGLDFDFSDPVNGDYCVAYQTCPK